jgi:hypothetical protein
MKITKTQLRQIIKEELSKVLSEQPWEVGHEPVTAEEEAARKEKAAAKHREKAQRLRNQAMSHTDPGGDNYTEEGRKLMAKAVHHEEQAAIVDGQAAKLRSGKPGREERGYGKHLEEIVKEELEAALGEANLSPNAWENGRWTDDAEKAGAAFATGGPDYEAWFKDSRWKEVAEEETLDDDPRAPKDPKTGEVVIAYPWSKLVQYFNLGFRRAKDAQTPDPSGWEKFKRGAASKLGLEEELKQIVKEELEAALKERAPRLTRDRPGAPSQAQAPSKCEKLAKDLKAAATAASAPGAGYGDEWHTQAALNSAEAAWKKAGCGEQGNTQ